MPPISIDIDTTEATDKIKSLTEQATTLRDVIAEANELLAKSGQVEVEPTNDAEANPVIKKGAVLNKHNSKRAQEIHDHAAAMGAKCSDGGKSGKAAALPDDGDDDEAAELGLEVKPIDMATIPLDVIVSDVRNEFWELRKQMRLAQKPAGVDPHDWWEWDDGECPECIAVFPGYAVAKVGLAYFKVPYVLDKYELDLVARDQWEQVQQEWVAKSIPIGTLKNWQRTEQSFVKSIREGRLGNYLVLWGDEKNRDLYGEYFTQKTAGLTAMFDHLGKLPALYQHAMDDQVKFTPIGTIDVMVPDEIGLWTETQLDLSNAYARQVQALARKRALGASSGTLPGARKAMRATGEITQWVIIEGSFTPTPAEPRMRELGIAEVKSLYADVGLELPEQMDVVLKAAEGAEEAQSVANAAEIEAEAERLRLLEIELSLI
jgi:hypothetical protein